MSLSPAEVARRRLRICVSAKPPEAGASAGRPREGGHAGVRCLAGQAVGALRDVSRSLRLDLLPAGHAGGPILACLGFGPAPFSQSRRTTVSSAAPRDILAANLASAGVNPNEARNVVSVGTQRLSGSIRTAIAWHSASALAEREDNLSKYTRSGRCPSRESGMGAASAASLVPRRSIP
jgi:hypothetical protein